MQIKQHLLLTGKTQSMPSQKLTISHFRMSFPKNKLQTALHGHSLIWVGRTCRSNWLKIQCNELAKALKVCSCFACIGAISVKTKLLHPSEVFIQAVQSKIFLHRCLLIILLSSQLVQSRGTPNKQAADTAHLPLGVSSETLKSKNFTKQFLTLTGGRFLL